MRLEAPFWWYRRKGALASALAPVGRLYGRLAEARFAKGEPYRSRLPVICIGNFTAGGGGKTPTAITVAALLAELGAKPAFLTRGYGGTPLRSATSRCCWQPPRRPSSRPIARQGPKPSRRPGRASS